MAGFIPGVGAVADLANAGLYAAEGDYLNAALSVASAIPGIGDTAALAKKSVNAVKGGLKSLKGIKNINALKKAKVKKKGKLEPPDEAIDAIKKDQKGLCVGDKCFTGDTLVYTKHGYKLIKEIRKGDEVYSRDEKTGETSLKEVVEVFCTTAHTVYHVWVDGKEEFKTTAYHLVYVQEQGWVTAINLCEGDTIEIMDGFVNITKVEKTRHEEPVPVYNFHVRDWASYFVGTVMAYVHNDSNHNINSKLKLSEKVRELMQKGDYRQALDIHYEDLIRRKTGGKSKIIKGREYDVVANTKLIQAKRSNSAISRPDNFLKGSTRKQIKSTAKIANELGLQPEYWFKYGLHPKVKKYIESKVIKVIIGLGD